MSVKILLNELVGGYKYLQMLKLNENLLIWEILETFGKILEIFWENFRKFKKFLENFKNSVIFNKSCKQNIKQY